MTLETDAPVDYDGYHRQGRTGRFHDVRERVRVRTIEDVVRMWDLSTNGSFLDVGAGEGRYLPLWRRLFPGARIGALEFSSVASARSAARYPFAQHIVASAQSIPLDAGSVDAIASVEVIEHVPSGVEMLKECHRVLKPSGWLLISTPCANPGSLVWLLARATGNIRQGDEHGLHFGKFDDPTHLRRYRSRELADLCQTLGFATEHTAFNLHWFMWLAGLIEAKVKGRVNIGRRSAVAERAFENLCDGFALIDWRLFRRFRFGSSVITVLRKSGREVSALQSAVQSERASSADTEPTLAV